MSAAPRRCRLVECFASLQGEGVRVGERQVFVRFAVCDRKCRYCDTPESIGGAPEAARVETEAGSGRFEALANPVAPEALDAVLARLGGAAARPAVSLTGGEPLLQAAFLEEYLPPRKAAFGFRLETHGLLPEAVTRVAPHVDEVVMDLKLPSATGEAVDWELHRRFAAACREAGAGLTMKAVVAAGTSEAELEQVLECFRVGGPGAARVLQPVTPVAGGPKPPSTRSLLAWQDRALGQGLEVRIVPQVHHLMGIR